MILWKFLQLSKCSGSAMVDRNVESQSRLLHIIYLYCCSIALVVMSSCHLPFVIVDMPLRYYFANITVCFDSKRVMQRLKHSRRITAPHKTALPIPPSSKTNIEGY